jgi:hypothetical protein
MSTIKTDEPSPPGYQAASTSRQDTAESLPIYTEQESTGSNGFLHLRNALANSHRDRTHDVEIWRQYIESNPPPAPDIKSVNRRDKEENFVILREFFTAIDNGQADVIQFLIEHNLVTANSARDTRYSDPPLLRAVCKGKADVVRTLIDLGAQRNAFGNVVCFELYFPESLKLIYGSCFMVKVKLSERLYNSLPQWEIW